MSLDLGQFITIEAIIQIMMWWLSTIITVGVMALWVQYSIVIGVIVPIELDQALLLELLVHPPTVQVAVAVVEVEVVLVVAVVLAVAAVVLAVAVVEAAGAVVEYNIICIRLVYLFSY